MLAAAYTTTKINIKSGRLAKHYKCADCGEEFTSTNISVDHIKPVVDPKEGFTTWDSFITNLFCSEDNLQVLCKEDHDKKTKEERANKTSNTDRKR